ncbi:MAG: alpha-N-arabinofuranosidase, partial [Duncaniella sp.]|nr:alpha-N-arabinofuranosidase [Duncaniella sp.]
VEGRIVTAKDIHDHSDFGQKEKVTMAPFKDAKVKDGKLLVTLPAKSVVTLSI